MLKVGDITKGKKNNYLILEVISENYYLVQEQNGHNKSAYVAHIGYITK